MKISPLAILLNDKFRLDKKFYFISGNEKTLMEKMRSKIIGGIKLDKNIQIKNIATISGFVDEVGLFGNENIYVVSDYKGITESGLNKIRNTQNNFIFFQENSQKIKRIKNIFGLDKDSYLIDCYELDKDSKIKILNNFLNKNKLEVSQEVYWYLIDRLDTKYIFFENCLIKIYELEKQDITLKNIKKILTVDNSGKEKIFFNILKKNKEIVDLYKDNIITNSDVNDLYYYSRYHCQMIIDSKNENEYNKKIPIYLFREKNYLMDIYSKYNSQKKKLLLRLLLSTENILRKYNGLSLVAGLRFILNIKKITIS